MRADNPPKRETAAWKKPLAARRLCTKLWPTTLAAEELSSLHLPREEGLCFFFSPLKEVFFISHLLTAMKCCEISEQLLLKVINHLVVIQQWHLP